MYINDHIYFKELKRVIYSSILTHMFTIYVVIPFFLKKHVSLWYFPSAYRTSFSIFYVAGLLVATFLSSPTSENDFIFPSLLKDMYIQNSNSTFFFLSTPWRYPIVLWPPYWLMKNYDHSNYCYPVHMCLFL